MRAANKHQSKFTYGTNIEHKLICVWYKNIDTNVSFATKNNLKKEEKKLTRTGDINKTD